MEKPRIHDALSKAEIGQIVRDGVAELKNIVTSLEKITGKRLDYDKLSQNLALEKEASRLWWEVVGMCRNIPSPMSVFDIFTQVLPFTIYRGEPLAVSYYQDLLAELKERVAQKIVPMAGVEKYRLYWDNLPIYYKLGEHVQKFASYGAVPVAAMFPFYFGNPDLDPGRPLESIVELFLFNPNNRGLKGRIDFLTKLIDDYAIDGFVMQRSRTCLLTNMGQDDIMKALVRKTGLPAVVIEGDMCDSRFYAAAEVDGKIDAFMEILAQRGMRRG
jgi:benzoyl-CoA reductase/2-hydroxyglutaryl-CoA dehydratase subunit BcrC/BadD/HgdB